jgi:hypothetical protein
MTRILSAVPFVLCSLLAPDTGAPAGGGSPAPAKPESPEAKPEEKPASAAPEKKEVIEPVPGQAAEASAAPKPAKLTVFQRAAALLKPRTELAATIAQRDATILTLTKENADLKAKLAAANSQLETLGVEIASFELQLDQLAGEKAIDLAAAQGAPPVRTDPARPGANEEDEVKFAFESAAQESDPRKRSVMFAKASAILNSKASGRN